MGWSSSAPQTRRPHKRGCRYVCVPIAHTQCACPLIWGFGALQAKQQELETFLRLRSAELVPGGRIVVSWVETKEGGGVFKAIHNVMNVMADEGWWVPLSHTDRTHIHTHNECCCCVRVSRETASKASLPFVFLPMSNLLEPWEGVHINDRPTTSGPLPSPAPHTELPLQLEAIWTGENENFLQAYNTRVASGQCHEDEATEMFFDEVSGQPLTHRPDGGRVCVLFECVQLVLSARGWAEGMVTSFMADDCKTAAASGGHEGHNLADTADAAKVKQFYVTLRGELVRAYGNRPGPLGVKWHVFVIRKM